MYHDTATDTALQFVLYIDSLIRFAENRGDASSNFVATNQLKIKTTCDKNRIQFLPISVVAIAFRRMASLEDLSLGGQTIQLLCCTGV